MPGELEPACPGTDGIAPVTAEERGPADEAAQPDGVVGTVEQRAPLVGAQTQGEEEGQGADWNDPGGGLLP